MNQYEQNPTTHRDILKNSTRLGAATALAGVAPPPVHAAGSDQISICPLSAEGTRSTLGAMDWTTILVVIAAVALLVVFKKLGQVGVETARSLLKQGAKVIDVRSQGEFQAGHLGGALNVPLGELSQQITAAVPDKETVLLLHCLSGTRSGVARRMLKGMGYQKVHNLGSYRRAEKIVGRET